MCKVNHSVQIGTKFNQLTLLEITGKNKYGAILAKFKCDCGNELTAIINNVRYGKTSSCGCYKKKYLQVVKPSTIHGLCINNGKVSSLYNVWRGIKKRCFNVNDTAYSKYGARGITMCDEWRNSFETFYNWCINNGWQQGLEIDRENNDGNYEPNNCRFVTRKVNSNNRRSNVFIEYNGKRQTVTQWANEYNLDPEILRGRLKRKSLAECLLIL